MACDGCNGCDRCDRCKPVTEVLLTVKVKSRGKWTAARAERIAKALGHTAYENVAEESAEIVHTWSIYEGADDLSKGVGQ